MEKLRNVFDYLSWRSSLILSLEEALKDSSIPDSTFSLKKVDLTSRLKVANKRAHGGSADVYVGQLRMAGSKAEPRTVAVKVSRLHVQSDDMSKVSSSETIFSVLLFVLCLNDKQRSIHLLGN